VVRLLSQRRSHDIASLRAYVFNRSTNANRHVTFTLPQGSYRFRADFDNVQFWSNTQNDCTLPACESARVEVTNPIYVAVVNTDGVSLQGLSVYAFNGSTYTGNSGITDNYGVVAFTLPRGDYRFRVDYNGEQYWNGPIEDCTMTSCTETTVTVGP
jgi:hypothetical protein